MAELPTNEIAGKALIRYAQLISEYGLVVEDLVKRYDPAAKKACLEKLERERMMHTWAMEALRLYIQGERGREDVCPGMMHCAKCKFVLTRVKLFVNTGDSGAGDNKTEPCPNGCGPLWPMTWQQRALEAEEAHGKLLDAQLNSRENKNG